MESTATFIGAFSAGKLPTQQQTNEWIDYLVRQLDGVSDVSKTSGSRKLSENGMRIASDLKQLLLAYKELGSRKNGDDQLQEAIWNLTRGQLQAHPSLEGTQNEAVNDSQQASAALQNMINIFWRHLTGRDGGAADFASFGRKFVADTAEVIEQHAGVVKEKMRDTESQVQQGERDPLTGLQRPEEEPRDTKGKFEAHMDTAKAAGSGVIGAGQQVQQSHAELRQKTSRNLDTLFDDILSRAEKDPEYKDSVTNVFDILSKWFNRSLDNVDKTSIDEIIHDPSGRVFAALKSINTLLERLAGGKSTSDLKERLRVVLVDIRDDPELRRYFDDVHDFSRRTLQEPNYARSQEHKQRRQQLRDHWQQLMNGENRRKWHDDIEQLRQEANDFFGRIENDKDVRRLQEASIIFGNDFAEVATDIGAAAMGNANWLWQDMVEVILPAVINHLKELPIPRTEYKDTDMAFVIENLKLDSFHLLPGRAHIRNTTDMDISKPSTDVDIKTKVRSHTRIRFQGVQTKIHDVSFWYMDRDLKPFSEISGLMGITIPEQGLDVDVTLGLIPQPDKKDKDKDQHAFFTIENVQVQLRDPTFTIRKSNHPVLFTVFKPLVRSRLERTIEQSLASQISLAIQMLDGIAYDVHSRAGVFRDAGIAPNAAYVSALWSELNHLRKQPGLFTGLKATNVGVVRDDSRVQSKFAIGVQPQIIPGEKHGPPVPGTQEKRDQAARLAKETKEQVQESGGAETGIGGITSFADEVKRKKEQEERREGWRSGAFGAPNKGIAT